MAFQAHKFIVSYLNSFTVTASSRSAKHEHEKELHLTTATSTWPLKRTPKSPPASQAVKNKFLPSWGREQLFDHSVFSIDSLHDVYLASLPLGFIHTANHSHVTVSNQITLVDLVTTVLFVLLSVRCIFSHRLLDPRGAV